MLSLAWGDAMAYSTFTNLEIKAKFGVEQAFQDGLFV